MYLSKAPFFVADGFSLFITCLIESLLSKKYCHLCVYKTHPFFCVPTTATWTWKATFSLNQPATWVWFHQCHVLMERNVFLLVWALPWWDVVETPEEGEPGNTTIFKTIQWHPEKWTWPYSPYPRSFVVPHSLCSLSGLQSSLCSMCWLFWQAIGPQASNFWLERQMPKATARET